MAAAGEIRAAQDAVSRETRGEQLLQAALGPARVRLGTLNNLRWLAVVGQTTAVLIVSLLLKFDFPIFEASIVIGASAILNIVLSIAYPSSKRLTVREATAFLGYDITQLAVLLFLTGGIENPFALLFLAPVVVSAATLNVASTLFLGGLSVGAITLLAFAHIPLPWREGAVFTLPDLYQLGIWVSLLLGIGFSSIYAWRIASEASRMSAALSATQLALAREHRLAALGGLRRPRRTSSEPRSARLRSLRANSSTRSHPIRMRTISGSCARKPSAAAPSSRASLSRRNSVLGRAERLPLGAFLDDIAAPHRGEDVSIVVDVQEGPPPKVWRVPEILHGLGNLLENAADFAASEVRLRARWDDNELAVDVMDDGPGFAAEIFEQIGEPYVTSRPRPVNPTTKSSHSELGKEEGMGLGFFIAKTLIEQTGGTVTARNRNRGGAIVTARWPRGAIDGEEAPREEFHL